MAHSEQDVERGLQALAIAGGNADQAERQLAELGERVPARTLRDWKNGTHAKRYAEIRAEVVPQIRATMAAQHEDLAIMLAEKQAELAARVDAEKLEPKDVPKAIQQVAIASAVHVDKATLMRGLPTQIHARATAEEILDKLEREDPRFVIDSDAFELPSARALPQAS